MIRDTQISITGSKDRTAPLHISFGPRGSELTVRSRVQQSVSSKVWPLGAWDATHDEYKALEKAIEPYKVHGLAPWYSAEARAIFTKHRDGCFSGARSGPAVGKKAKNAKAKKRG